MDRQRPRPDLGQRDGPSRHTHLVVVLVAAVDRRVVPAIRFLSTLTAIDVRAVHIAEDAVATRRLAYDWMALDLPWLPLTIRDATAASLITSIRDAVAEQASGYEHVTVLVPELVVCGRVRRFLHRGTARALAVSLQGLPRVTTLLAPTGIEPP